MIYNVDKLLRTSGLSKKAIEKIKKEVRKEFPDDEMMYGLHIVRILNAIKKGYWKVVE